MLYYLIFPTPPKSENYHIPKEYEEMTIKTTSLSFATMSIHSAGPSWSFLPLISKSTKPLESKVQTLPGDARVTF